MKALDISKVLDQIAPPDLAYKDEELGFVAGDFQKEVEVLGVTERPTLKVLQEAVDQKVDMLIVHEPLYHSEKSMLFDKSLLAFSPNKKRKEIVEKGGFAIFRFHSQWDETKEGNNDTLAKLLGINVTGKIPFGRIGTITETTLENLAEDVKRILGCERVLVAGDDKQKISKVAVVAGSGNSLIEVMDIVKTKGVDVLISGDIQDGRARYAAELGLSIIDAGDYFTENPGAKHLAEILQKNLTGIKVILLDPGKPWFVL